MSIGFGSDIASLGSDELMEQFSEDVPCKRCGKSASLRSLAHGCGDVPVPIHACVACWQAWFVTQMRIIAAHGSVKCMHCAKTFLTVEAFSDYRPF